MAYSAVRGLLGLLIIINIVSCTTQERIIDLWPEGKIPNQKETNIEEVHEFTDILRISKVQKPTIEVFLPDKSIATGQALLIFPGGGYKILAYDKEGTDVAKFLNERGIAGIVVKYRLPSDAMQIDKHKVPLIDAQRAIRIVRSRAGEWNIDPKQIGIIGFSAGGHLASTLGTKYRHTMYSPVDEIDKISARPDFMALLYPVITMREKTHKGSRDNLLGKNAAQDLILQYSIENQITENTPPTYVIHAMDDTVVPVENREYFHTMHNLKSKAGCRLYLFEKGGHGFGLAQGDTVLKKWPFDLIEWMNSLETE
jgi:acetyl esterase/lipase